MSKHLKHRYKVFISHIGEKGKPGYVAIIPTFNDAIVFGDTMDELIDGINFCIDTEIEHMQNEGLQIPIPEQDINMSGKISLRIEPVLHKTLVLKAKANNMSLNKYIESKLEG